jgi:IS4 transposase
MELFFKWIKQHLRIKQFYGTSENAVKTQIWIAVSVYVLVAIIRKRPAILIGRIAARTSPCELSLDMGRRF